MASIGRNEPCPCGSGLKYKKCCALKANKTSLGMRVMVGVVTVCLLVGLFVFLTSLDEYDPSATPAAGLVWSEAHQHWH